MQHCKQNKLFIVIPTSSIGPLGRTLLHIACSEGCPTLAKLLIRKYNVDIYARDMDEDTPLHKAARGGKKAVMSALNNEFGCDTNVRNIHGDNFLHTACFKGQTA